MEFNTLVKKRTSIRKFSSKKPAIEKAIESIEVANLAPSPGNLALARYILIEDNSQIEKIAQACRQPFLKQAQLIIVICSDQKQAQKLYDSRANTYTKQAIGAATQNLILDLTNKGLATTWVGAFSHETISNTLNIPEGIEAEVILPIGYKLKTEKAKPKQKPTLDNRIFFESFGNKHKTPYKKIGGY
jgi:nitroreductase